MSDEIRESVDRANEIMELFYNSVYQMSEIDEGKPKMAGMLACVGNADGAMDGSDYATEVGGRLIEELSTGRVAFLLGFIAGLSFVDDGISQSIDKVHDVTE